MTISTVSTTIPSSPASRLSQRRINSIGIKSCCYHFYKNNAINIFIKVKTCVCLRLIKLPELVQEININSYCNCLLTIESSESQSLVPRSEHLMTTPQDSLAMCGVNNIINSRVGGAAWGWWWGHVTPIKSLLAQNPAPAQQWHALNSFNLSQTINILITSQRPGKHGRSGASSMSLAV